MTKAKEIRRCLSTQTLESGSFGYNRNGEISAKISTCIVGKNNCICSQVFGCSLKSQNILRSCCNLSALFATLAYMSIYENASSVL